LEGEEGRAHRDEKRGASDGSEGKRNTIVRKSGRRRDRLLLGWGKKMTFLPLRAVRGAQEGTRRDREGAFTGKERGGSGIASR